MYCTTEKTLKENTANILEKIIKYNEPVNIVTSAGNAVIISESDYNDIMETLYLCSIPGMEKKIIDGLNTPDEECIPAEAVKW